MNRYFLSSVVVFVIACLPFVVTTVVSSNTKTIFEQFRDERMSLEEHGRDAAARDAFLQKWVQKFEKELPNNRDKVVPAWSKFAVANLYKELGNNEEFTYRVRAVLLDQKQHVIDRVEAAKMLSQHYSNVSEPDAPYAAMDALRLYEQSLDEFFASEKVDAKVKQMNPYTYDRFGLKMRVAYSLQNIGDTQTAIGLLNEYMSDAEQVERIPAFVFSKGYIKYVIGDFHRRNKDWDNAIAAYQKLAEETDDAKYCRSNAKFLIYLMMREKYQSQNLPYSEVNRLTLSYLKREMGELDYKNDLYAPVAAISYAQELWVHESSLEAERILTRLLKVDRDGRVLDPFLKAQALSILADILIAQERMDEAGDIVAMIQDEQLSDKHEYAKRVVEGGSLGISNPNELQSLKTRLN